MVPNASSNNAKMVQKIKFLWDIQNIDDYKFKPGEYVSSSRFFTKNNVLKSDWKLFLYPGGYDTSSTDKLALGLRETSRQDLKILEKCSYFILNNEREIIETFTASTTAMGKDLHCSLSLIEKKGHQCNWATHEGTLSILCELDLSIPMETMNKKITKTEQMQCTSVVKKESTVSSLVGAIDTEKSVTLPYGKTPITILYSQTVDRMAFYMNKKERLKQIFYCRLEHKCLNGTQTYDHEFRLLSGFRYFYLLQNCCDNNTEFEISINFSVDSPLDAVASDWTTAKQRLQADLQDLFIQPNFGDVVINVAGKTLRAHRDILIARSSVFAAMFTSGMLESQTNIVTITDIHYETIHAVLKYIYYGMIEHAVVDVADLFMAASRYDLTILKKECERLLSDAIDNDNVTSISALADYFNSELLKNAVITFRNATTAVNN